MTWQLHKQGRMVLTDPQAIITVAETHLNFFKKNKINSSLHCQHPIVYSDYEGALAMNWTSKYYHTCVLTYVHVSLHTVNFEFLTSLHSEPVSAAISTFCWENLSYGRRQQPVPGLSKLDGPFIEAQSSTRYIFQFLRLSLPKRDRGQSKEASSFTGRVIEKPETRLLCWLD